MKNLLKHIKQFLIILIICFIVVIVLNYSFNNNHYEGYSYLRSFIIVFSYTLSIYLANSLVLNQYFSEKERKSTDFIKGFILTNILTVFVVLVLEILGYLIFVNIPLIEIEKIIRKNFIGILIFPMFVSSIVYIILANRKKDKSEVIEHKTTATKATASFESLKSQLDPHFLFNSLNVLSSLIDENPKRAQEFTISLSKIYRYVLEHQDKNLVSTEDELNFAKSYVDLLQMRFENGLIVNFPNELTESNFKMIPLSLQLLLENAIKHNIVSESKPLIIDLFFEEDHLIVKNNYQKKETFSSKNGIGLENIINRYALISDKTISINQSETNFIVKLPLISEQTRYEYQQEMFEIELFETAYEKMVRLKEFYVTIWVSAIGFPLSMILNIWIYPEFKWSYIMGFFMVTALLINGFRVVNLFGKWEQNMIQKQLNKK